MQDHPDRHPPFMSPRLGPRPFVGGQPPATPRFEPSHAAALAAPRPFSPKAVAVPEEESAAGSTTTAPPHESAHDPFDAAQRDSASAVLDVDQQHIVSDYYAAAAEETAMASEPAALEFDPQAEQIGHDALESEPMNHESPFASDHADDPWVDAGTIQPPPPARSTPRGIAAVVSDGDVNVWAVDVPSSGDETASSDTTDSADDLEWWGLAPETPPAATPTPDEYMALPPTPPPESQPELWLAASEGPTAAAPDAAMEDDAAMWETPPDDAPGDEAYRADFDPDPRVEGNRADPQPAVDATLAPADALARRLETMAQRVRAGEIVIADGASERSDAAVLAALLSAMLGGRD